MIRYELKKVFRNRYILAFFLLFFLINIVLSYYQAAHTVNSQVEKQPEGEQLAEILAMFERYEEDPEGFLEQEYKPMVAYKNLYQERHSSAVKEHLKREGDLSTFDLKNYWEDYDAEKLEAYYAVYTYFARALNDAEAYKTNVDDVVTRAKNTQQMALLSGLDTDSFDYKYQSDIVEIYSVNRDIPFDIEYTRGWDHYFSYTGMNLCALLFLMVLVPGLLLDERQSGIFPVIHTTKRGYVHLILSKLAVLLLVVCMTVVTFSAASLITFGVKCEGFSSLSNYIQAFSAYTYCPFIITVGEYFAASILIKALALFAVGTLILLLSWLIQNHALTYLASVVLLGGNFVAYIMEYVNANHPLRLLNLFSVLDVNLCFTQYHAVDLFGHAVPYLTASLALWGGIMAVAVAVTLFLFCRVSRGARRKRKKKHSFRIPRIALPCTVRTELGFEAHKLLIAGKYLILILLVLLVKLYYVDASMPPQPSVTDDIYREYAFLLEGEWTPEKSEYIADERAAINEVLLVEAEMEAKYVAGEIAYFDYNDYRNDLYDAKIRNDIFARIEAQESHILALKERGVEAHFVYTTGWNALYSQTFDFFLYGLLLVLSVQIFSVEFHGMQPILRATKKGRGYLLVTKYLLALSIALAASLLFAYIDYEKMMELYTFTAGYSPAQSLPMLAELPLSLSLRGFFFLYETVKALGFVLLAVLAVSASVLVRKAIHSMAVVLLATLVPFVLGYFGFDFAKFLDFTCLMSGSQYIRMSLESALYFVVFTICVLALTTGLTVWGCRKWRDGM